MMEVECGEGFIAIIPEDEQDKAFLESLVQDGSITMVRSHKPRGFVSGPDWLLVSEQQQEQPNDQ